jgi:hypothetical protein
MPMHVALVTTFHVNKKEPLAALLERIHSAFLSSGLEAPAIQFSLSDAPVPGFVSSVDRVIKRYPELQRLVSTESVAPGGPPIRQISNWPASPAAGQPIEFATLLAIAAGVQRSFPFHNLSIHFQSPAFGLALPAQGHAPDCRQPRGAGCRVGPQLRAGHRSGLGAVAGVVQA